MSWILFRYFAKVTLPLLLLAAMAMYLLGAGRSGAIGLLIGGMIMFISGSGLVFGISHMLDPSTSGRTKGGLGIMLLLKFTVVVGLLYFALEMGVNLLGLMMGLSLGLMGLTLGVSLGTASEEGQAAIKEAEAQIARDLAAEDSDAAI